MALKVKKVNVPSILAEHDVQKGDILLSINGNEIRDVLDYTFYSSEEKLDLNFKRKNKIFNVQISKNFYEDMGLEFYQMRYRRCVCNCIFCFIDQMHPDSRPSLKVKDDDYRLSFILGNYITLVNLHANDYKRIIKQKLSPLYISVHTTNDKLRKKMMRYNRDFSVMKKLKFLAKNRIRMHTQIVLVPGYNDGKELKKTVDDLSDLYPQVQTIGVVPVGLTKYREDLTQLSSYDKKASRELINKVDKWRDKFWQIHGSGLIQLADEFYLLAEKEVPSNRYYEGYAQIENGIGMVRQFIDNSKEIIKNIKIDKTNNSISLVTATLAYPIIKDFANEVSQFYNVRINVIKVSNKYLGKAVTVSGLLAAKDVISAIKREGRGDLILLPQNMFNTEGIALDDKTVEDIKKETGKEIQVL